tara:strand:- start:77 stop:802 length:726 start_codon:yes stop_codon:yes gene_type:complete
MNKVLFCLPTLFNRPEKTVRCTQNLLNQCEKNNIEYQIFVVSNVENEMFSQWDPGVPTVTKLVSGLQYNISKALNITIDKYESDYFAFLHDDMFIHDEKWIDNCIKLYENEDLNCGVIGCKPHTTDGVYKKPVDGDFVYQLDDVLWADGVMFFSTKLFDEVGTFDESYFGDRESQDFCYKVKKEGYINYRAYINLTHESVIFGNKANGTKEEHKFNQKVIQAGNLLHSRWDEWQDEVVRNK